MVGGEPLHCNSVGCNLHDYLIRAWGVCVFLDHTRRQDLLLEAQMQAQTPSLKAIVEEATENLLDGLSGLLDEVLEGRISKPTRPTTKNQSESSGGGILL